MDATEKINLKIRDAQLQKVPCMLVIGGREAKPAEPWPYAIASAAIWERSPRRIHRLILTAEIATAKTDA